MKINEAVLRNDEKVIFALRNLYSGYGYRYYRMNKFEEYDLYADNKEFLVSDNVITFTDTNGKLMALKPDVTLSIISNSTDEPSETRKLYYNENVYRVSKSTGTYKEIMQTGVECFGKAGTAELTEILTMAAESLRLLSDDTVLDIGNQSIIDSMITGLSDDRELKNELYKAVSEKNVPGIIRLCSEHGADAAKALMLSEIIRMHGSLSDVLPRLLEAAPCFGFEEELSEFCKVVTALEQGSVSDVINIDLSVINDNNYYNGIVFKGFIKGIPIAVITGGQYDRLMRRLHRKSDAIGFAVYLDALTRIDFDSEDKKDDNDGYINVALPKGRLGEKVYRMFADAGYECPSILEKNRKLIFVNEEKKVKYFWVKPSDVAIYVERGAADVGVAGRDILLEYEPDLYELLDLKTGKCRMAVAGPKGYAEDPGKTVRVATKFTNIAKKYYQSKGCDIDIIHLNGSIELAPILGLSDVIVDIVETGSTLRENNLEVVEEILPISARLIANKSSYKFKSAMIDELVKMVALQTEEEK